MVTEFHTLSPKQSLGDAVHMTLAGPQSDFPVVEVGEVIGILTQGDLLKGLSEQGPESLVSHAIHNQFETARPGEDLETAFRRLQLSQCRTLPVLERGQMVGLLTRDNIMAFLNIQSVMAAQHHGPRSRRELAKPVF
jgi:CBS domain-containing protein